MPTAARGSVLFLLLPRLATAKRVTISNTAPRLSVNGDIVNAHDGTIRWFDGAWWMHAAEYGECWDPPHQGCEMSGPTRNASCGFEPHHNVSIWRSPDLSSGSWQFIGHAVRCAELADCAILYRPHLVFNPATRLYVLFWNYVDKRGQYAGNQAATASSPAGPFTVATHAPINTSLPTGDFDVLVDPNGGIGYIAYSAQHLLFIEQLSPDLLSTTGVSAAIPGGIHPESPSPSAPSMMRQHQKPLPPSLVAFPVRFVEAPVLFERRGRYYALFGHCCCFCYQGSGMFVFTARSPLGPWTQQREEASGRTDYGCVVNATTPAPAEQHTLPRTAVPTPGQGCLYGLRRGESAASATRAQQNFVLRLASGEHIWTGDRWMQAPDGIKGHEPQFWGQLAFDRAGRVQPLEWVDELTIDV